MAEPFVFAIFKELLFVLSISAFLRDADGVNQFVLLFLHLGLCLDAGQLHRFQRLVDGVDKDAQDVYKRQIYGYFLKFLSEFCPSVEGWLIAAKKVGYAKKRIPKIRNPFYW